MSDVPGWTGLVFLTLLFVTLRWVCYGLALPIQITCSVAGLFIWRYVLRVPDLRTHDNLPQDPLEHEEGNKLMNERTEGTATIVDEEDEEDAETAVEADDGGSTNATVGASEQGIRPVPSAVPAASSSGSGHAAAHCRSGAATGTSAADAVNDDGDHDAAANLAVTTKAGGGAADAAAAAADAAHPGGATASSSSSAAPPGHEQLHALAQPDDDSEHDEDNLSDASYASESDSVRRRREEDMVANPERAQELRIEGNEHFKAGKLHDAREAYSEAIYLTPSTQPKEKAVLHANRAACLQKLGRWEEVVEDCKAAVDLDSEYLKAYCRRSIAYEELKRYHDAFEDLKKAVELDPSLKTKEHRRLSMLEAKSQEQFEKDKEEMIGKLKELGNTVLGKFGMSCDNFKFEQDPNTGGYSVKFQQ